MNSSFHIWNFEKDPYGWCLALAGMTFRGGYEACLLVIQRHAQHGTRIAIGAIETPSLKDGLLIFGFLRDPNNRKDLRLAFGAMYMIIIGRVIYHLIGIPARIFRNIRRSWRRNDAD